MHTPVYFIFEVLFLAHYLAEDSALEEVFPDLVDVVHPLFETFVPFLIFEERIGGLSHPANLHPVLQAIGIIYSRLFLHKRIVLQRDILSSLVRQSLIFQVGCLLLSLVLKYLAIVKLLA